MTKLANVEKIEKTIFTVGSHFTVKNTVTTGVKGKDNVKLNPVYTRTYNSTKYSDKAQLEQMSIRTSDYVVLAYNDFQNKINEEIYISYPHMAEFINVLTQAVQMVTSPDVYVNNAVNPKYSDLVIKPQINMGGQKSFAIIPHVIQHDQAYSNGILLFMNSEDIYVEIDGNSLFTLYYILKDFNLYTNSAILLTTGLIYDGAGSSESELPSFGGNTGNTFGSNTNRAPRGIFGGGNNTGKPTGSPKFKAPTKNTTLSDLDKVIEGGDNIPPLSDDDVPFTGGETKNEGNKSPLSLNSIMNAASEIEVPDLGDGDVDFE